MRITGTGLVAVLAMVGLGLGATASLADEHEVVIQREEGKIRIVTEDEDGNRQERTIELDGPRAFLGVRTEEAESGGAMVESVVEGTAAERAGVRAGDVIVGLDGAPIGDSGDLMQEVLSFQPGDRVDLELMRDGRREVLTVDLGEREQHFDFNFDFSGLAQLEGLGEHLERLGEHLEGLDFGKYSFDHHDASKPKLGVHLVQPTSELREHLGAPADAGLIVGKVLAGMPAEEAGILVGDLIVSADAREIEDTGDLRDVLRRADGETIELELIRDGAPLRLDVYIPSQERDD